MLDFNKILLPLDLEDPSLELVHQTAALARHFHSEVLILHVIRPLSHLGIEELTHGELLTEGVKKAEAKVDGSVLQEFTGITVKRLVLKGDPAGLIVEIAHDQKATMIVMGTHGFGPVARLLVGSVTAKVLNRAECPVWAGTHLDEERKRNFAIRNVVCGIDFGFHTQSTVRAAAEIAAEFGAKLTLAHVTPGVEIYGPGGYHVLPEFKQAVVSAATEHMTKLQQEAGTKAEVFIGSGDVAKVLSQEAKQSNADLLVIGRVPSHGRLGGSAYSIIREAHIPVLAA
jgi:nucleotide-binding universal stress UspA family protein